MLALGLGAGLLAAASIAAVADCCAAPFPEPVDLGHGVHVFLGARAEASPANGGHVANPAFIVAPAGGIVIETGLRGGFLRPKLRRGPERPPKPGAGGGLRWAVGETGFGGRQFPAYG